MFHGGGWHFNHSGLIGEGIGGDVARAAVGHVNVALKVARAVEANHARRTSIGVWFNNGMLGFERFSEFSPKCFEVFFCKCTKTFKRIDLLFGSGNAVLGEALKFLSGFVFIHADLGANLFGAIEFDLGFGEHSLKCAIFSNATVKSNEGKGGFFNECFKGYFFRKEEWFSGFTGFKCETKLCFFN